MGSTGDDDSPCLFSKIRAQEVEKQGMSDMIDCESGLDLVLGVIKIKNLQSSIEHKGFDGWIALFRVVCSEGTDLGQTGQVKLEIFDIAMTGCLVDGDGGFVLVGARSN